ncbi:MAG: chloride channel protein [Mogibacterium sp.]|nr:chloride channel protein [Mogibacterium sp.]
MTVKQTVNKTEKISIFCIITLVLGFVAGSVVWTILQVMQIGIDLLWTSLPGVLGLSGGITDTLVYSLIVCLIGGLFIGLGQKRYGSLPHTMEEVMAIVKTDGGYPYNHLPTIALAALMPLIFGGALGPEAGLSGLIAGICCWIGDTMKYKADKVAALAEAGLAATLGVIFGAPLFGIAKYIEPKDALRNRKRLVTKPVRVVIYCFGVAGGMLAFVVLSKITGLSAGLPRFDAHHAVGLEQWKWFLPLIAVGIVFALYYAGVEKITHILGEKLSSRPVTRAMIAGACVAVAGTFLPLSMFSGEHQMAPLIEGWQTGSPQIMVLSAVVKLALVSICINFGWKGGSIFPIIFSGALLGYTFALIVGMDGAFAVAVLTAALYAYVMRQPVTVVMVLLLCFPVTYIIPLAVSALIAGNLPNPFIKNEKNND